MNTTITIPEKASIAEYKALLVDARAQEAGIETIFAILDMIAAKEARIDLIAKTKNFKPTQAKLFVRRTTEEEIEMLVPDSDVFDDIELQEIIRKATGLTRAFTDDDKLADYQALKAEGATGITYDKEKECVVANPVEAAPAPPTAPTAPTEEGSASAEGKDAEKPDAETDANDKPEDVENTEG